MAALGLLLVLLFVVAAIAGALALARWVLGPLEALAQTRRAPTQFTLSDLLVLFALLQLFVGTIHYLLTMAGGASSRDGPSGATFCVDGFVGVFLVLCWVCGVNLISRAGINRWWHRAMVLGLLLPCGIIGSVATVFLGIAAGITLFSGPSEGPSPPAIMAGLVCVLLATVAACARLTRWVVARSTLNHPPGDPRSSQDASRPEPGNET